MMGPGFADKVGVKLAAFVLIAIVIAFSFGALAVWGLPLMWEWLKPFIHTMTKA